jgi:hypothetical protein
MGKTDVVMAQKAAVLAAQDAALEAGLGACYDQGLADAGTVPAGGFTQADIEAAVTAAKAADAEAMRAAVSEIQTQLDTMTAKEQMEEQAVAVLQQKLDAIKALLAG